MHGDKSRIPLQARKEYGLGFLRAIPPQVPLGGIRVTTGLVWIYADCLLSGCERLIKLPKLVEGYPHVDVRSNFPRVSLLEKLVGGLAFLQLSVVSVVVGGDVKAFRFTGPVFQLKRFVKVGLRNAHLSEVAIDHGETGIGHGKVRIQFDGALV